MNNFNYLHSIFPHSIVGLVGRKPPHRPLPVPLVVHPLTFVHVSGVVTPHAPSMPGVVDPIAFVPRMITVVHDSLERNRRGSSQHVAVNKVTCHRALTRPCRLPRYHCPEKETSCLGDLKTPTPCLIPFETSPS